MKRAVVQGGGKAPAEINEGLLARPVALVHAGNLRHGDVRLVDDEQMVFGEEIDEAERAFAGGTSGEVARIILDAVAKAQLAQHFQIVAGPLLQALSLEKLSLRAKERQTLRELGFDGGDGAVSLKPARDEMLGGIDPLAGQSLDLGSGQRIEFDQRGNDAVFQRRAQRRFHVSRKNIDDPAFHSELAARELDLVPLIMDVDKLPDQAVAAHFPSHFERDRPVGVGVGRADVIDTRDGGDDDDVAPGEQRARRFQAQAVDAVVDRGIFFDVGVRGGDVGLGLVVVVVGDEKLNGVFREEGFELGVQLRGENLVRRENQRGALQLRDGVGDGEGLAGSGDPEKRLGRSALAQAADQGLDGFGLVAGGLEGGAEAEKPRYGHLTARGLAHRAPNLDDGALAVQDVGLEAEALLSSDHGQGREVGVGLENRADALAVLGGSQQRVDVPGEDAAGGPVLHLQVVEAHHGLVGLVAALGDVAQGANPKIPADPGPQHANKQRSRQITRVRRLLEPAFEDIHAKRIMECERGAVKVGCPERKFRS